MCILMEFTSLGLTEHNKQEVINLLTRMQTNLQCVKKTQTKKINFKTQNDTVVSISTR